MKKLFTTLLVFLLGVYPIFGQSFLGQNTQTGIPITNYAGSRYTTGSIGANETTCTSSATSSTITLAAAKTFQNNDGISCYGAGATNIMSTPGAPTVTPSEDALATGSGIVINAPSGSTSFSYTIAAIAQNGSVTAIGSVGTTSTGNSLGSQSATITGESIAANSNVVTVTMAAPETIAAGQRVALAGQDNYVFTGEFKVASRVDSTHFTYNGPWWNYSASPLTTTGGTAYWYQGNHLTWSAVTGAWQYAIYNHTSGSIIGLSLPGNLWFDDWGSTISGSMIIPPWVPSTEPGSATNGVLTTTIVSGGGTSSLTVKDAAMNSVSGGFAVFDNAPAINSALAAVNHSSAGWPAIYLPPITSGGYYVIGSFVNVPNYSTIRQGGAINTVNTIQLNSEVNWFGALDGTGEAVQFSQAAGVPVTNSSAYPMVYGNASSGITTSGVAFVDIAQGTPFMATNCTNSNFSKDTFSTSGYLGVGWYGNWDGTAGRPGVWNIVFEKDTFIAGFNSGAYYGQSNTPAFYSDDPDNIALRDTRWAGSGIVTHGNPHRILFENPYFQGERTPMMVVSPSNTYSCYPEIVGARGDTSPEPVLLNLGTFGCDAILRDDSSEGSPFGPIVTGIPEAKLTLSGTSNNPGIVVGQNFQLVVVPYWGTCTMSSGTTCTFSVPASYAYTPTCVASDQGNPVTGSCSVSSTTATITAASSNSDTWSATVTGNPN